MRLLIAVGFGLFLLLTLAYLVLVPTGLISQEQLGLAFENQMESAGRAWASLLVILLLTIDLVMPVPSSAVMTLSGYYLGVFLGALVNFVGAVSAAVLGFWVCQRYGQEGFQRMIGEDGSSKVEWFFRRYGDWAIILSRPVPMVTEVISCLAGLSRMSWRRFLMLTSAGSLPISLVYAWAGHQAQGKLTTAWAVLIALVFPVLGYALFLWLQKTSNSTG